MKKVRKHVMAGYDLLKRISHLSRTNGEASFLSENPYPEIPESEINFLKRQNL